MSLTFSLLFSSDGNTSLTVLSTRTPPIILKHFLLFKIILNYSYNDIMQVQKKQLYHTQNLKINSSAKHNKKDNQNCNNDASEINDESTQHVIRTADKRVLKSFYKDSIKFADQSDA